MRPESRQDKLERLAARVTAGEVVFFIGAGFSLESERNSTQVLIARLLARVEALCEAFAGLTSYPGFPEAARDIRKGLRTTFWLKEAKSAAADAFGTLFDTAEPAAQDATTKAPGA